MLFFFFSYNQVVVEMFFHYFFLVLKFIKNCFNKFVSSIFAFVTNYWLSKFIINTNKFVSKTTGNVISIFSCVRTFITFNTFQNMLKVSINFKQNWNLFDGVFKFNCSFLILQIVCNTFLSKIFKFPLNFSSFH